MKLNDGPAKNKTEEFTEWVEQYSDELYKRALFKLSDVHLAEDLVQDTFLSAFNAFDNFKGNSSVKTWLMSILNNKITDHYRKKAKTVIDNERNIDEIFRPTDEKLFNEKGFWKFQPDAVKWLDDKNFLDIPAFNKVLEECMQGLPDNWREILLAKYILEKKSSEICKEFKISSSNYWQIVHRSKLMMKLCIDNKWFKI